MTILSVQAFTWNGFEDGTTWMGGLWAGLSTQQGDFATITYRAQLYGFNAVRIPFRCALLSQPDLTTQRIVLDQSGLLCLPMDRSA